MTDLRPVTDGCACTRCRWAVVRRGTEKFVQAVLDAVYVSELLVSDLSHFTGGKLDLCADGGSCVDTKESVEGVRATLDLFDASAFNCAKV